MDHVAGKSGFGISEKGMLNPACSATETNYMYNIETVFVSTLDGILKRANNKCIDQTARMRRLICAFVVRIQRNQCF